jgi:hypothetical protein
MAELGIPEPYRAAFGALAELDEEHVYAFLEMVAGLEAFQKVAPLQQAIQSAFPAEGQRDAARLVPAILSLRGALPGTSAERMAEMTSRSADLDLSAEARVRLRDRLLPLLQSSGLKSTSRALELLTQHPRNYREARVFTDIRPVFGDDAESRPDGAVIVGTLQLRTWDRDGLDDTIYVAMDEADLRELAESVKRALDKSLTLRRMLADQQIACFTLDERDR